VEEVKDRLDGARHRALGAPAAATCALARTLAVEPEVILKDEPCSAARLGGHRWKIEELMPSCDRRYTIVIVHPQHAAAGRVADTTAPSCSTGDVVEHESTDKLFTPRGNRTEDYVSGKSG